jgi:hypothetical protein
VKLEYVALAPDVESEAPTPGRSFAYTGSNMNVSTISNTISMASGGGHFVRAWHSGTRGLWFAVFWAEGPWASSEDKV